MKLTNVIRDAFVRAVMADVPFVDYQQQGRDLIFQHAIESMPPLVRAAWDSPDCKQYINQNYWHNPQFHQFGCCVPSEDNFKPAPKVLAKLKELATLLKTQAEKHQQLKTNIRTVALSVTTRKALADALPEFEKYLPEDEAKANRLLPCVQNVVADFVKAGWPKGQPKPSTKAKRVAIQEAV